MPELTLKITATGDQAVATLRGITEGLNGASKAAIAANGKVAASVREATSSTTAHAQSVARLQGVQGNLAGAVKILTVALAGMDKESAQGIKLQTALAAAQNKVQADIEKSTRSAARAQEAGIAAQARATKEAFAFAQATARSQRAQGDFAGAVKTLEAQLLKLSSTSSAYVRIQAQINQVQAQAGRAARGENFAGFAAGFRGIQGQLGQVNNLMQLFGGHLGRLAGLSQHVINIANAFRAVAASGAPAAAAASAASSSLETVAGVAAPAAAGMAQVGATSAVTAGELTVLSGGTLAVVAALALVVTGGVVAAKSIIDFGLAGAKAADQLGDMAAILDVQPEFLHKLGIAYALAGKDIAGVEKTLTRFEANLGEAASGNAPKLAEALAILGLTAKDAGQDVQGSLTTVLDILSKSTDQLAVAAAAQSLFGKGGLALVKIYKDLNDPLTDLNKKMKEYGLLIGNDTLKTAGKLADAQDLISVAFQNSSIIIASQLAPSLIKLSDQFLKAFKQSQPAIERTIQLLGIMLGKLGSIVDFIVRNKSYFLAVGSTVNALTFGLAGKLVTPTKPTQREVAGRAATEADAGMHLPKLTDKQLEDFNKKLHEKDKIVAGGAGVAKKASETVLKLLELELKTAERVYSEEIAAVKRSEDLKLKTHVVNDARILKAEEDLLTAKKALFAQERVEIEKGKLPKDERTIKLKELAEKEIAAEHETRAHVEKLRDDAIKRDTDALGKGFEATQQMFDDHQQRLLAIEDLGRKKRIDAAKAAAARGDISFLAAERIAAEEEEKQFAKRKETAQEALGKIDSKIAAEEIKNLKRRADGLDVDLTKTKEYTKERERLIDELQKIMAELGLFEQAQFGRNQDAMQHDIDVRARYNRERRENAHELAAIEFEARAQQIQNDLDSFNPAIRKQAMQEAVALKIQEEDEKHKAINERIRLNAEAEVDAAILAGKDILAAVLDAEKTKHDALLAEDARFHAAQLSAALKAKADLDRANPTSARSLLGDDFGDALDQGATKVQAVGAVIMKGGEEIAAQGKGIGDAFKEGMGMAAQGLNDMFGAWMDGADQAPGAAKRMVHGILKQLAQLWLIKGIGELAEGFAALFIAPEEAAKHFAAAEFFFIAAALAGIGARVTRDKGGAAGASGQKVRSNAGGGKSSSSGGGDGEEDRTITLTRGLVTGMVGGFKEVLDPWVVGQQNQFLIQKDLMEKQQKLTQDQQAALDRVADSHSQLGQAISRLESMPVGEVIGIGAEQNPEAFALGTAKGADQNTWHAATLRESLKS